MSGVHLTLPLMDKVMPSVRTYDTGRSGVDAVVEIHCEGGGDTVDIILSSEEAYGLACKLMQVAMDARYHDGKEAGRDEVHSEEEGKR